MLILKMLQVPIGSLGPSERGGGLDLHCSPAEVASTGQSDVLVPTDSPRSEGRGATQAGDVPMIQSSGLKWLWC